MLHLISFSYFALWLYIGFVSVPTCLGFGAVCSYQLSHDKRKPVFEVMLPRNTQTDLSSKKQN